MTEYHKNQGVSCLVRFLSGICSGKLNKGINHDPTLQQVSEMGGLLGPKRSQLVTWRRTHAWPRVWPVRSMFDVEPEDDRAMLSRLKRLRTSSNVSCSVRSDGLQPNSDRLHLVAFLLLVAEKSSCFIKRFQGCVGTFMQHGSRKTF